MLLAANKSTGDHPCDTVAPTAQPDTDTNAKNVNKTHDNCRPNVVSSCGSNLYVYIPMYKHSIGISYICICISVICEYLNLVFG